MATRIPESTVSSPSRLSASVLSALRGVLGGDAVLVGDAATPYGKDRWFAAAQPEAAVFPSTTAEVSAVLRIASEAGVPVTTRGAGHGYVGGCVPVRGGILLSVERMNKILEVHTGDFVAVVQAGAITGKVQAAAREVGLFYPPDPASLKDCSIGGNIATNAGGPRCLKYGVTRQYILGLEVVLMDGRVLRVGGRTHKNKTGFDLVGVFTGSEGLLGVITEATLRLLPHPPYRGAISAGFRDIQAAAAGVQAIFSAGFLPAAVEVADAFTLRAARKFRNDARIPPGDAHLILEVDGQRKSVVSELADLAELLRRAEASGVEVAEGDAGCETIWDIRRSFSESLKATGLRKLNEDIVVPRGKLVDLMRFAEDLQGRCKSEIACFGHAGDGNIHVNIMVGDWENPEVREKAEEALDELFLQVIEWGGAITGEHGIGLAKKRWWDKAVPEAVRGVHGEIKAALDPQGLLNPGKFV